MKKLLLTAFAFLFAASFVFAADISSETPTSIYAKILNQSYIGKYKTIIIDKSLASTQLPAGMSVKSKTYYADNKFREETTMTDDKGKPVNIVTIFTSSDTYVSYDSGANFFSIGAAFMDEVGANIKNIDPFTPQAAIKEKTETVNGAECYVIEDNGGGLERKFYVEIKTYNVMKSIISNDDVLIVTDMSDYKKVDKYTAPFTMKILVKQKTGEKQTIESTIKIRDIQFNPRINNTLFQPNNVMPLPEIPGMNIKEMIQSMF